MKHFIFALLLLFATQAVFGADCDCDDDPFSVATFNSFQISIAPFREERLNASIEYFANTTIDVLCVQELWDPVKRDAFIDGLKAEFPYSYYAPRVPGHENCTIGCGASELSPFVQCVNNSNCSSLPFKDFVQCAFKNCSDEFAELAPSCLGCLSFSNANETVLDRFQRCLNPLITSGNETQNGTKSNNTCEYFFGGWSDNVILSKYPFIATNYTLYDQSPLVAWTALYAKINDSEIGYANIFCTHLSADIPLIETEFANRDQSEQLTEFVKFQTEKTQGPIFIMGDFNSGPAGKNITAAWLNNYQILATEPGWKNLYVQNAKNVECTYCKTNPFVSGNESYLIDHIFGARSTNTCVVSVDRFATENIVTIENLNATYPLSDHYGVRASICKPNVTVPIQTDPIDKGEVNTASLLAMTVFPFIYSLFIFLQ
jgi:endonuclease/exonuclease/phosphatase family metal-dependent hydrolase